jgi:predicted transcriptional regulator
MAFTLRLSDDLDEALAFKSALTGVPKAVIARRAIERELGIGPMLDAIGRVGPVAEGIAALQGVADGLAEVAGDEFMPRLKTVKAERKSKCAHGQGPEAFCKKCDG